MIIAITHMRAALQRAALAGNDQTFWYFGASYADYLALRNRFPAARWAALSEELNTRAERHYPFFVGLDRHLHTGRATSAWLASDLAERNPLISSLPLDCCRALALLDGSRPGTGRHLVVVDDVTLGRALAATCRRAGRTVDASGLGLIAVIAHIAKRGITYMRNAADQWRRHSRIAAVRQRQGAGWTSSHTLVVSWGDSSKPDLADPTAKDTYLGDLPQRAAGGQTIGKLLLPRPWLDDPALLAEKAPTVLLPDDLWRKRDILRAALLALSFPLSVRSALVLDGHDLSPLLRQAVWREMTSWRPAAALLFASAAKGLAQRGLLPKRLLLPFENQPWEKTFLRALHAEDPDIEAVALQHMPYARLYLSLQPTATDIRERAVADRILLTGPRYRDWLVAAGMQPEALPCIGSLRLEEAAPLPAPDAPAVLCCCPIDRNGALELALRAAQACHLLQGVRLTLNLHSACSAETQALVRHVVEDILPGTEVSTEPAVRLFARHGLVLYNTSGVCFEAIRHGRPVLLVPSEIAIDTAKLAVPGYIAPSDAAGLARLIDTLLTDRQAADLALAAARAESDACIIPRDSHLLERLFPAPENAIRCATGER